MSRLAPAPVEFTAQGPASPRYGDRYHGMSGALAQAQGVFLAGCGLPGAWRGRRSWCVVETGFGLGFNFLACWQAWREDPARCARLDFLSIERHPVGLADLARAHAAEPALAALARQLRLKLPPPLDGCHRLEFEQGRVCLTLVYGDGATALAELDARADTVFLDGFAPDRNPELWDAPVLAELARLARPGARLATWCATGALRRALATQGFAAERGPGFGGKRETTRAARPGEPDRSAPDGPRHALVLGAGVAGCQVAERLCRRGWQVQLFDAGDGPALAASGNPAGVVRPLLSRDDNRLTRWTRAAFLYACQAWTDAHGRPDAGWHPGGALQLARDEAQARQWQQALAEQAVPGDYAAWLDATATARRCGLPAGRGGLLFPGGGWAQPREICRSALAACGEALQVHWQVRVAAIEHGSAGWQLRDASGRVLGEAPQLVLAVGAGAFDGVHAPAGPDFLPAGLRPLQVLRGETTQVAAPALAGLEIALCGDGYLVPNPDAAFTLGATYDRSGDALPSAAGRTANLAHLSALTRLDGNAVRVLGGRAAWRSVAADRIPVVGADPDGKGLWHLRALASRGLVWSALAAELLASRIAGEASPLARSLVPLLAPQRAVLRQRPAR